MKLCLSCESNSVVFGKTKIKVGRETFETEADHCITCKKVAISSKLQRQIEIWASQFTKSIVELQPYFAKAMYDKLELLANRFNLTKPEFMKICTTYYILEMTKAKNFKILRQDVLSESKKKFKGVRKKVSVPIKYQLFKRIRLYANMWNLEYEANVMEEAVEFCVVILDSQSAQIKESKKEELVHFVEQYALAS
jgi:hypothetical protein